MGGAASKVSSAKESLARVHTTLSRTIQDLQRVDAQAVAGMRTIVFSSQGGDLDSKLRQIDQAMRLRNSDWDIGDALEAIKHLDISREQAARMPYSELLAAVKELADEQGGGGRSKSRRRKRSKRSKRSRRNKRT